MTANECFLGSKALEIESNLALLLGVCSSLRTSNLNCLAAFEYFLLRKKALLIEKGLMGNLISIYIRVV